MNVVTKFLEYYSYRFPKGYPDLSDPADKDLLRKILSEELDLDIEEGFNPLSFGDLKKYDRLQRLNNKIQSGEPFILTSEESVVLLYDNPEYEDLFANADITSLNNIGKGRINTFPFFIDKNGKQYAIKDLVKDKTFGGKGTGSGTRTEDIALTDINNKIQELGSINIVIGNKVYENVNNATTVPKTPKADFTLNSNDTPLIFISHKDGSKPTDFQQYSGLTGLTEYDEVQKFIDDVKAQTENEMQPKQSFFRKINSDEVKLKSVYGLLQSTDNFNENNCQILLQGPISLELIEDNAYKLTSNHTVINPSLPDGEYEPYFAVTFRNNRNNFGLVNGRFGIYPKAYIRNATEI